MASEPISFRLTDSEAEALKALRRSGESLSLAAQRIVRQTLGVDSAVSDIIDKSVDIAVDKILDSDRFGEGLDEKLASLISTINQKFIEQEERIEALEKLPA